MLYRFDDQLLVNQEQLTALVRMREVDDRVPLTLYRDGDEMQLEVVLKSGSIVDESIQDLEARHMACPVWQADHMGDPKFQNCAQCHDHPFERSWNAAEGAGVRDGWFRVNGAEEQ